VENFALKSEKGIRKIFPHRALPTMIKTCCWKQHSANPRSWIGAVFKLLSNTNTFFRFSGCQTERRKLRSSRRN